MESSTPHYLFQGDFFDEDFHTYALDDTNKTAYLAADVTLIVLTFLLNVAVIAVIVYLYVKRPTVTNKSPHFIPMLACCVAEIIEGVFDSVFFNMLRVRWDGVWLSISCRELIAHELSYAILSTLPMLLVAAVIFTQSVRLRLQRVVTLTRVVQKVVAVVLVVLSVVYVVVVVIAVFYMTFVEDNTKVCEEDLRGKEYVNFQSKLSKQRVLPAVEYIVPSLFILLSSVVLLLAQKKHRTTDTVTLASTSTQSPGSTATPTFPFNVLLAAASCILLYFVFFLYQFRVSWFGLTRNRMCLAGITLEKLNGVFLPCFWLLDADIRALWCCCGNASRASPEVVTLESSEGKRMENGGDDMNGTLL